MASITIRNLDDAVKNELRRAAAENGRSMEEEARLRLAQVPHVLAPHDMQVQPQISSENTANDHTAKSLAGNQIAKSLAGKQILLIIGGSIAAYKALDLIRRLRERGAVVRVVMTKAAQAFITPLAAGALSAGHVFTDLFSRTDEQDVGHIRLAREADMIVVAPCTADRMAKMAAGQGDDLAGAVLLAARCPVLCAPAMNPAMWAHRATVRNVKTLHSDGIYFIGPERGEMAEKGEAGEGRMSEPLKITAAIEMLFDNGAPKPLEGRHIIVTSGPTHEPIDPVRYLANRSSGKQGHAIAAALAALGAEVTLVCGPVSIPDPQGVRVIHVETAREMLAAVESALPADAAVFVAAVADWRTEKTAREKIKKKADENNLTLDMVQNPDILATIGHSASRPSLVIGFAAETFDVIANAQKKLAKKGADWIVANDVSFDASGSSIMGGEENHVRILSADGIEEWPKMGKTEVAAKIAQRVADALEVKR